MSLSTSRFPSIEDRFNAKWILASDTGCWLWIGCNGGTKDMIKRGRAFLSLNT